MPAKKQAAPNFPSLDINEERPDVTEKLPTHRAPTAVERLTAYAPQQAALSKAYHLAKQAMNDHAAAFEGPNGLLSKVYAKHGCKKFRLGDDTEARVTKQRGRGPDRYVLQSVTASATPLLSDII